MKKLSYKLLVIFFVASLTFIATGSFAQKTKRPNILFAISDDQSYAHTSMEGCTFVNTPAFNRIATEGIYFTNCYASSPGCAPSRSSIVTGRHPWQNEQSGQHGSSWMKKYVPFVDELANNGYSVGRTGKGVDPFRYAQDDSETMWRKENAAGPHHKEVLYDESNDERPTKGIYNVNYFESFKYFMENVKGDKPFFFWFGAKEPHRGYEKDSWEKLGKRLEDVQIPDFLPDNNIIRGDLLDYAIEIEWFDTHLQRMLKYLEKNGELDNTIVIVTSDNGMPFPRAKANSYNFGSHVPMAIRYPKEFLSNHVINERASFIDLAPTILEMTQTTPKQMQPITGKSMVKNLKGKKASKDKAVFIGRERHSSSRYQNWGYPQRAILKGDHLLVWNLEPERWPAGDPQAYNPNDTTELLPMHKGAFNDIDGSPSKKIIIEGRTCCGTNVFFRWATDKRPEFELFDLKTDKSCLFNVIEYRGYRTIASNLKSQLLKELKQTKDPRIVGPNQGIFDSYKRYGKIKKFPIPE